MGQASEKKYIQFKSRTGMACKIVNTNQIIEYKVVKLEHNMEQGRKEGSSIHSLS